MNTTPFQEFTAVIKPLTKRVCDKESVPATYKNCIFILTTNPAYKDELKLAIATQRRLDAEIRSWIASNY